MSKITPKNLSYDPTLPPFLQRLQENNSSRDGRNGFQSARPKKARNPEDEVEDEPVYFDEESGETLSKREWEEKEKAEEGDDGGEHGKEGEEQGRGHEEKKAGEKESIAAIGGSKKRKAGKVIGANDEDGDEKVKEVIAGDINRVKKDEAKKGEGKIVKKKGKKVKLSFGDEE
ncbi:hypothetical protein D0Z07_4792 [Hyphodiscus hymeniophilus]|uniref:DUF4604 domain-containing protein n=1 Tax=Hyphodiscus hymeniophilus TaxID=353542 RepID=A0A9P6VIV9_9HELO|nr:hypothetical protein D0Z07_4792 [Hyphodiscus hymeniophilus]